mgnify:CR=1 FL=1
MIKKILFSFFIIFFTSLSYADEIFLSLKKDKVNVRYGPSFKSPIKYVYKKLHLPIKQIDKKENFRRIVDIEKNSGWIHVSQQKKNNSVITTKDKILFKTPATYAKPIAFIKKGRLLILEKCQKDWCKIVSNNYKGWIITDNIWGYN